jgi:hypothetical protein
MSTRNNKPQKPTSLNPALFLIVVGGLLVLVVAALLLNNPNRTAAAPQLSVDREVIDFGPVKVGEMVTADFTLTNTGSAPLTFTGPPRVELKQGC